jgi:hypothetical protein
MMALMMEAIRTSETSVYFNETTLLCVLEGCHLHTFRCEKLKSYKSETVACSEHKCLSSSNKSRNTVSSSAHCA